MLHAWDGLLSRHSQKHRGRRPAPAAARLCAFFHVFSDPSKAPLHASIGVNHREFATPFTPSPQPARAWASGACRWCSCPVWRPC